MMKNDEKEVKILMKSNIVAKAKFNITTIENRIFQLVMYKLQKKGTGILSCEIHLDEFKSIIKNKNQVSPEAISEILVSLRKQSIYFKKSKIEQLEEKKNKKSFSIWGEGGIINNHEYDEEKEVFTIEASEKIHNFLHDYLEGGYTPINLGVFFSLSNSYAQRFYDLLRLWTNTKKVITYSLDELKELLMIEGKYSRYVDFKRRVIVPAITELNKTGMFEIEISENRKGKTVESIDFIVTDLDKRIYGLGKKESQVDEASEEVVVDVEEVEDKPSNAPQETILPEETFLVKPLHRLFKIEFKGMDFSEGEYYMAFVESEVATQIQDGVEEITMKEWGYFKATLRNKIDLIRKEEEEKAFENRLLGFE